MPKAVFLDRDGVINESILISGKPYAPRNSLEFKLLPGVKDALMSLRKAGYLNVVITNQPDVATGKQSKEEIEALHEYLCQDLAIDLIVTCYHTDAEKCACRKPNTGMLTDAANDLDIDISQSYMVGDRWRDIECGQRAGCKEVFFIDYGYNEKKPDQPYQLVTSLADCAKKIVEMNA